MTLQRHQNRKFRKIKADNLRSIPTAVEDESGTFDYNQPHLPKLKIGNGAAPKKEAKDNRQWRFFGDRRPNFDLSSMFGYDLTFLH
jgi:hypothetical protein